MAVADADDRPETRKARPEGECIVVELKIFLSDRKVLFSPILLRVSAVFELVSENQNQCNHNSQS